MENKVVLVTGAGKGIGFSTAKKFAEMGYCVALNNRSRENGEQATAQLKDSGYEVSFFQADVTVEEEVDQMVKNIIEKYGRIDCLVNNAGGLGGRSLIAEMKTSFWDSVMDLNLKSSFYTMRAVTPYMKQNGGAIINLTSIAANTGGGPGASVYAASKGAITAFTRGASKEFMDYGVRVNAVSPGTINTDFHSATDPNVLNSVKQSIPAKRLGLADEVANVIYFLASEESSFMIGEVVQVNGAQVFV